jgi:AmmeMemoRadiSam system protein B
LSDLPAVAKEKALAAMTPHAGLKYSGRLAADVWRRLTLPETVLILGPKHTPHGVNWAIAPQKTWQLSSRCSMENDLQLAGLLAEQVTGMQLDSAAHAGEHGIEIQLPILFRLAPKVRVAAIAMGSASWEQLVQASEELAQLIRSLPKPPLLVISSDMNHFANDFETRRRDQLAIATLAANDPHGLLEVCQREQVSMCGQIPAALVLLTMAKLGQQPKFNSVGYATSGEVTGDLTRVVGYAGAIGT